MTRNRKPLSESEILDRLSRGQVEFPPLKFRPLATRSLESDMLLEAAWKGQAATFAVECKSLSTPRAIREATAQARALAAPANREPMVVVPFLSKERVDQLEREGISGIDLCGNGVVQVPGKFAVYRTGAPNRFPSSAPIKNIYQKNSSMVGRVFLARPRYGAVMEIRSEIQRRSLPAWQPISLATVSKVLRGLEDDLIVNRGDTGIWLVQPDKLLSELVANFAPEDERVSIRAKVPVDGDQLLEVLAKAADALGLPVVATGAASVTRYAVMQRGPVLSLYCTEPEPLLESVGGAVTDRFPNVELVKAAEPILYFDARIERGFRWASPAQVYLELMAGDKRDRETAEQMRDFILNEVRSQSE